MAIDFKKVGDKMSTSGEKQKKTGEKLISYSEDFKAFGQIFENDGKLDNALESTETAVKVIRNLLAPPVNILKGIGNGFNAIVVPDLDVFTRRIDIPVVGRITIDDIIDVIKEEADKDYQMAAGLVIMATGILVHIITLPVEYDASFKRALPILQKREYLHPDDLPGARKVLRAAAFTYLAAAMVSLLDVMRWLRVLRF